MIPLIRCYLIEFHAMQQHRMDIDPVLNHNNFQNFRPPVMEEDYTEEGHMGLRKLHWVFAT